jgi:hypothetical protein
VPCDAAEAVSTRPQRAASIAVSADIRKGCGGNGKTLAWIAPLLYLVQKIEQFHIDALTSNSPLFATQLTGNA